MKDRRNSVATAEAQPSLPTAARALGVAILPSLALFVVGMTIVSRVSGDDYLDAGFLGFLALFLGGPAAYLNAFVFGLPAYLLLRRRFRTTFLGCAIGGAATATAPLLLLSLITLPFNLVTIFPISGIVGLGFGLMGPLPFAALGALAGLVFRLRLKPQPAAKPVSSGSP